MKRRNTAPWLRVQATLSSDPKVIRAGFLGGVVFRAVLEMMKAQGWAGKVADHEVDGSVLRRHLNCGEDDPSSKALAHALSRCVEVGLLQRKSGQLIVPEWDTFQPDSRPHSSERDPKDKPGTAGEAAAPTASPGLPGTPGISGDVTRRDVTRRDETRRGEENPPPPPLAPAAAPPPTLLSPANDEVYPAEKPPALSPGLAQELSMMGVVWRKRPAAYQAQVMAQALVDQGVSVKRIAAWLTDPRNSARSDFEMRDDLAPRPGRRGERPTPKTTPITDAERERIRRSVSDFIGRAGKETA